MNKISKTVMILISLLITVCLTTLAALPNGAVVIGDKAYDINYVNDEKNYEEVLEQLAKANKNIYVKGENGKWYDNSTGKIVEKNVIPAVTYKNVEGVVREYAAFDGEEIVLKVCKANFINTNELKIEFNKVVNRASALNKDNYKVDGQNLSEEDSIKLIDNKTVVIKLKNAVKNRETKEIQVSKEIKDANNNIMLADHMNKMIILSNEKSVCEISKKVDYDIDIIAANQVIKNANIKGDIYINADKVTVRDSKTEGNVYINPGKDGTTYITKVSAKNIAVLSGGENSIHIKDVTAEKLNVSSDSRVRVVSNGTTKIGSTTVQSYAIIDSQGGTLGEILVTINTSNDGEKNKTVEFKGTFKEPIIVESAIKIKAARGADIKKLQIAVKDSTEKQKVELEGNFKEVQVDEATNLDLQKGKIEKLTAKAEINITTGKNAKIYNIKTNGQKITQDGKKVEKDKKETVPSDDSSTSGSYTGGGSHSGGSTTPSKPTVSLTVSDCKVDEGKTVTPTIGNPDSAVLSFTLSDEDKAIVAVNSSTGEITGIRPGKATITVTGTKSRYHSRTESFTVTVNMVKTEIDGMIDRLVEAADKTDLAIYNDKHQIIDSYKNYITYAKGNNHTMNITIKQDKTVKDLLNKKWELEVGSVSGLLDGIKKDFRNIKISGNDFNDITLKEYARIRLENSEFKDLAGKLPKADASAEEILNFIKSIYGSNNTTSIIKAMGPHGDKLTATVYGKEIESIKVTLDGKTEATTIYDNSTEAGRTVTSDEIRNIFGGGSFRNLSLNDLKGNYKIVIGGITYTVNITE